MHISMSTIFGGLMLLCWLIIIYLQSEDIRGQHKETIKLLAVISLICLIVGLIFFGFESN